MSDTIHCDISLLADMASRSAFLEPMTNEDERPTITVAGVHVALYVDPASRQVRVSVDLDDTAPWLVLYDDHRTVPLQICVQPLVVFDG